METKEKKSVNYYMRALHRDVGFFVIGLAIIYSISGVLLIYRDTDFLKSEQLVEKKLSPGIAEAQLGEALKMRNFKAVKTEGDIIYFQNGNYNKSTGEVKYTQQTLPAFIEKLTGLHKTISKNSTSWFSTIFGLLLLFLTISSFWMFKVKSKLFRRGIVIASVGFVITIALLIV